MKSFRKVYKLILTSIIVLFPFIDSYAINQAVPIGVDWFYEDEKWNNSPHRSDIKIDPINNAPLHKGVDEFYGIGDLKFNFIPEFDKVGKYEYLVYQNNEDIEEDNRWVRYDRTVYRLVYLVQENKNGLTISTYAYDDSNYDKKTSDKGKVTNIVFKNHDPHRHRKDGSIIKPKDPENTDGKKDPEYPEDPNKPIDKTDRNNKNSSSNVKTGVEGMRLWLIILILAIAAITILNKKIISRKS
ncbi:MAG: FctA domain-containing protein [Anaerococcus sp.]|uniref:Spy0128 family protein n=1 Tax=Anaerococcus sp. TaxID=1872515 RepID=UPI002903A0F3|nr:FctA domain-containing protein [Anaerococcus sp.]MDU2353675.1 FctA domain-containing protein [Anaerococcus sp.]